MKQIDFNSVYYFINGQNNRVVGWDEWMASATPNVYCNGWHYLLMRNRADLYETEQEAIEAMNKRSSINQIKF